MVAQKIIKKLVLNKVALITGVTVQDGAYLSEFLLKKDFVVNGIKRRSSLFNTDRIDHFYQDPHIDGEKFILHYFDMTDSNNLTRLIKELARIIQKMSGHQGKVTSDSSKPDGKPRKLLDLSKMNEVSWQSTTGLEIGIKKTYQWFLENFDGVKKIKL